MLVRGSFEDIIYILIGVAWIAYSIYKGTQKSRAKAKKKEDTPELAENKKSVFETFFDDVLVEEKAVPYEPVLEDVTPDEPETLEEIPTKKPFSYDDYFEESNYKDRLDVYEKSGTEKPLKQEQKTIIDPSKKRKKLRIDLRKAVVYSEILNRRYF